MIWFVLGNFPYHSSYKNTRFYKIFYVSPPDTRIIVSQVKIFTLHLHWFVLFAGLSRVCTVMAGISVLSL